MIGASKVARDITERKQAETALREADRRKDEFLALWRTSCESSGAVAEWPPGAAASGRRRRTVRQVRDMMDRQLGHMVRLIDDLLESPESARTRWNSAGPRAARCRHRRAPSRRPGRPSKQSGTSSPSRFPRSRCSSTPTSPGSRRSSRTFSRTAPSTRGREDASGSQPSAQVKTRSFGA